MDLKVVIDKLARLIDPDSNMIDTINISMLNDGDEFLEWRTSIVLSIVNIEEDKTLKNTSVYIKDENNPTTLLRHRHPTLNLMISLLFASYTIDQTSYLDGIDKLKVIIAYFQQNNSFYYKNDDTELLDYPSFMVKAEEEKENYSKITMESISLTIEQLNQMWSYLGSKYMPSVLYKMRLCSVQSPDTTPENVITKVKVNLWENNRYNPIGQLESSGDFEPET